MAQGKQSLDEQTGLPRLNGNILVGELIRNMELGRFEMAYAVLLPCVFTVYVNPADYAMLQGVLDLVVDDARKALRARAAELNSGALALTNVKRSSTRKEYKIAGREWEIEFLPDAEVPLGDVEIHSELNESPVPGFCGTKTTLLGREPSVTQLISDRHQIKRSSANPVYAVLTYQDDSGSQIYLVTANEVRIGRGGDGQEVNLILHATDEISREHVTIRRDPATAKFSIIDASTNGTWLNGARLRKGVEEPLPEHAEIVLGEVLRLVFETRPAQRG